MVSCQRLSREVYEFAHRLDGFQFRGSRDPRPRHGGEGGAVEASLTARSESGMGRCVGGWATRAARCSSSRVVVPHHLHSSLLASDVYVGLCVRTYVARYLVLEVPFS